MRRDFRIALLLAVGGSLGGCHVVPLDPDSVAVASRSSHDEDVLSHSHVLAADDPTGSARHASRLPASATPSSPSRVALNRDADAAVVSMDVRSASSQPSTSRRPSDSGSERGSKIVQTSGRDLPPAPPGTPSVPGTAGTITLRELEEIALANNPTLPMAVAEIEKERGLWKQAGLYPNPTLGYVNSSTSKNGDEQKNGALIQQTFITGGKLEKAQEAERFGIRTQQWQLEAQKRRVLNDVRLRYFDVVRAQQQEAIAEELQSIAEKALKAAQELLKAKQVPQTDVLQAEIQLETVRLAVQNARTEREAAWRQLAVIVGCPQMPLASVNEPELNLRDFVLDEEWQRLQTESPQLRTVEAQVGIARAELSVAKAAPIPDVTLQVVSDYDSIGKFGTVNSLVALPVPLFNRNQGQIYTANQELHRAKREVDRVRLVLRDQLVASHRDYVQARDRAERLRKEILPRLRENLDLTISGYRQSEFAFLSVLSAQQLYFQSNQDYIEASTRARKLDVEITGLQLTGGLNPATIGTAIQEAGGGGQQRVVQSELEKQRGGNLKTFAPGATQ